MSRHDVEQRSGGRVTQADIDEIVEEIRAELEENPNILCELLDTAKAFNESMRRMAERLEESNRRGERNRREIDALMAEIHAQAR